MANVNTIASTPLLPGNAVGASSTSEIQFLDNTGANAVLKVGPNYLVSRKFKIKLGGRATGGTTTNLTVKLYTGAALGSNLLTSGAVAINSVSGNFQIEAELETDPTSKNLQGLFKGQVNATAVAQAATTAVGSIDATVAQSFSASATFSASNAGNLAILEYFELEAL